MNDLWLWIGFNTLILLLLALDLFVFNQKPHEITTREAAITYIIWVTIAVAFGAGVYALRGAERGLEYFAGYLIEVTLSVDNMFVFVLIFSFFRVPLRYQHRVLFWGIFGALVMRGVMIAAGTYLIHHFHWILYVFGAFLVFSGIRMAMHKDEEMHPANNPVIRLVCRLFPVTKDYREEHFFVRQESLSRAGGYEWAATPLFVVLALVETTDLLFAVDSIPAVFAVTSDPFVVYSSNVFAILGLRALYFILADVIDRFHFLKNGLSVVLVFVGVKLLVAEVYKIPIAASLGIIVLVLGASVAASLLWPRADNRVADRSSDSTRRSEH
jgi:TerC family integral membrane protein